MSQTSTAMELWHRFVAEQNPALLDELLADEVVFHSPFLWKPKPGKDKTTIVLTAAVHVFQDFTYHRELTDGNNRALEFSARVGDFSVKGIDLIRFNEQGKIVEFEVFIRPVKGLQALADAMVRQMMAQGQFEAYAQG